MGENSKNPEYIDLEQEINAKGKLVFNPLLPSFCCCSLNLLPPPLKGMSKAMHLIGGPSEIDLTTQAPMSETAMCQCIIIT